MTPIAKFRALPKVLLHEHLDCSLRPRTMLELWAQTDFNNPNFPFPLEIVELWLSGLKLNQVKASRKYQSYLVKFAGQSLTNYVKAIVDHVLPLMQSVDNLYRITKERIEDARNDGIVALELRFAPQLHTMQGLSLDEVMQAVIRAVDETCDIQVKLIVCALRHENAQVATKLSELCLKYGQYVSGFDLAADESLNPGVLEWWLTEAVKVRDFGIGLTIHLWETNNPTEIDLDRLNLGKITRLGHGIRGQLQGQHVLEICPTSNVVTGQVKSFKLHPIHDLYVKGHLVTVNTDGTLFTNTSLSKEYQKLRYHFNWDEEDFLQVNRNAISASYFSTEVKDQLLNQLLIAYQDLTD